MGPYFDNGIVQLYQADAREIPLPGQSVHCVVTSPPYFGLRVYKDNDDRGIGLEASVEAYVANMVDVFREVRRVLRDDGVCWLNLGDSYGLPPTTMRPGSGRADGVVDDRSQRNRNGGGDGNRLGIPERVVMALQSDGWVWRDTVIWAKKSAMPESVNGWRWERCRVKDVQGERNGPNSDRNDGGESDVGNRVYNEYTDCPGCPKCEANDGLVLRRGSWRTTSSHEYIYMLTKGMGYFCDAEAVKTANTQGSLDRFAKNNHIANERNSWDGSESRPSNHITEYRATGANRRSVWNDISPEPYGGSHFATFPSDLPRLCIQASTSEKGVCPECGSQWARVVEKQEPPEGYTPGHEPDAMVRGFSSATPGYTPESKTIGWRATCGHAGSPVPATVLDPFAGTATTMLAAQKLGRRAVGTDISEAYLKQAVKRLTGVTLPLI